MKRLRLLIAALTLLVISVQEAQAQVKLGDNPGNIDANALLELESTTKGFLLPRMSTVQRLAMTSPTEGMMVYDKDANCTYIYRAAAGNWYSLCSADSLTASNGLTKVGRDIQLGGTLNQATQIQQAGNNLNITGNGSLGIGTNSPNATTRVDIEGRVGEDPLRLGGLRSGASTDSIMTLDAATGILKKRTLADVLQDQDQYVWKLDGNLTTAVRSLGTKSNFALPIITNNVERMRIAATGEVGIGTSAPTNKLTVEDAGGNPLKLVGVQGAAMTDSVLTINSSGIVRRISMDSIASQGITAENAITKTGNIVRLGGNLNRATSIGTDATNTLAVAGLQGSSAQDSVVMAGAADGVLRRMKLSDVGANSITANNGITKTGNNVKLGGTLSDAVTTITTDATHTFAVAGLQSATSADSVVLADKTTGELRRMSIDSIASRGVLADNGLTKTGNKIQLGGTLLQATTIAQANNTMAFTGGQVGVGTTTPQATFHVAGSMAMPIATQTGSYTATLADHTLIFNLSSAGTLTLPAAASCPGRTYIIIKGDATGNVLTLGSGGVRLSTTQTMPSVNYNVRLHIQSDGTDWWLIARF